MMSEPSIIDKSEDDNLEFGYIKWNCMCECGRQHVAPGIYIRSGHILSCGCLADEMRSQNGLKQKEYNEFIELDDVVIGFTSKGEQFQFSLCDYDMLKKYCWNIDAHGYVTTKEPKTGLRIKMHKLITGEIGDYVVDHKNRDKTDNTRPNLRIVTKQENTYNHSISKNNKSGYTGVIWHTRDNIWEAYISIGNKTVYLGRFANKQDAVKERLKAEFKYFGADLAPQKHLFNEYKITNEVI